MERLRESLAANTNAREKPQRPARPAPRRGAAAGRKKTAPRTHRRAA